jgi:thiamine-monophosphate kinase
MVEGVHFKLDWTSPEALGARALTVNLSDIAAMGGIPTACGVNLAVRDGLDHRFFDRLYAGLRKAARETKVDIIGGNITRDEKLAITIAVLGEARHGAMRRDTARVGDAIFVTGTVGDAALGLRILQGQLAASPADRRYLIARFLTPTARIAAGQKLVRLVPQPAAIDISDGLWQDLGHILKRSGLGAEVAAESIPLSNAYRAVAGNDVRHACTGGDDYELLFCMPRASETQLRRKLGVQVTRIGTIVKGRRATLVAGGRRVTTGLAGWNQLRDG